MSDYTFNPAPPSVWDAYLGPSRPLPELVASRRSTTSSKTPGQKNKGTIYHQRVQVEECPDCHRPRRAGPGPHSPHFNAAGVRVDCIGFPV